VTGLPAPKLDARKLSVTAFVVATASLALYLGAHRGSDGMSEKSAAQNVAPAFSGARALRYIRQICELGPRPSGSEGMHKQQELLENHFRKLGAVVLRQRFMARQRSRPRPVEMVNLIARWYPERSQRVILCAHYDTRPIADQEPDRRDWHKPFLGANDGASGPALLMELAHHLPDLRVRVGVDFVLFDGEEYIFDPRPQEAGGDVYFLGSEYFARDYSKSADGLVYQAAILLDMVAGRDARFYYEQYSWTRHGRLVKEVWDIARELGVRRFVPRVGAAMLDDHLALQRVGIPAIDIIDADYPHWHRLSDTPEQCAPDTLTDVGIVVAEWLRRQERRHR